MLNEKVKGKVKAQGEVYGEVWYVITTEYPFVYYEEKETGKKKNLLAIKFLNKDIELTANKFKHKKIDEKTIIENKLLPIKIVKQCQKSLPDHAGCADDTNAKLFCHFQHFLYCSSKIIRISIAQTGGACQSCFSLFSVVFAL